MKTKIKTEDVLSFIMGAWGLFIIGSMVYQGFLVLKSYL